MLGNLIIHLKIDNINHVLIIMSIEIVYYNKWNYCMYNNVVSYSCNKSNVITIQSASNSVLQAISSLIIEIEEITMNSKDFVH